jgi:hypothetical protein
VPFQSEDDFYDLSAPAFFQQGDIFPDAPLISIPPSEHLVIIRNLQTGERIELFNQQDVRLHHEQGVNAFTDGEREHVVVSAQRGMAMVVTQTCDLVDNENWLVCPCYSVEGSDVNEGMLFSEHPLKQHYRTIFGLPAHPNDYFGSRYVDLADIRSIHSSSLGLSKRIASLNSLPQQALNEKIALMFSRQWGHSEGEEVPRDGKYRCNLCNRFDGIQNQDRMLRRGDKFPKCDNCARIRKRAQWYILQPHKRF